ncbi:hypothetical protein KCU88_g306, partial [Aureobasidium melanogenum]
MLTRQLPAANLNFNAARSGLASLQHDKACRGWNVVNKIYVTIPMEPQACEGRLSLPHDAGADSAAKLEPCIM